MISRHSTIDEERCLSPFLVPDEDVLRLDLGMNESSSLRWLFALGCIDDKRRSVELNVFSNVTDWQKNLLVAQLLSEKSQETGGHVEIRPEFTFCPVLIGSNSQPVFLYEFVETLDDIIDYDRVKEELPILSTAQISGALAFLRRVSQFNVKGVDIDALEDEELTNDEAFLNQLRKALADQEVACVFNSDKSNR
jgi:hypothetical protein